MNFRVDFSTFAKKKKVIGILIDIILNYGCPGGSEVKNPPAMQEMRVQSLGREDPLEREMATHSNILAWETPWTEEPGGYSPWGCKRVGHDLATKQ